MSLHSIRMETNSHGNNTHFASNLIFSYCIIFFKKIRETNHIFFKLNNLVKELILTITYKYFIAIKILVAFNFLLEGIQSCIQYLTWLVCYCVNYWAFHILPHICTAFALAHVSYSLNQIMYILAVNSGTFSIRGRSN